MSQRTRLATAAVIAAAGTAAHAAETTAPLVVTATRTPMTADDALAAVDVITRADIERQQPADVPDLLRGLPGVSVARNGGRGKASSVFLRGTNSDHTLVLIDGVRVGSATTGSAALEQLPVSQIERIEVVRGPRASLYGADAIGGVIQIFTDRDSSHARLAAGNREIWEFGAGVANQGERGGFSANVSGASTGGFDATDEDSFFHDPDDDGYQNRSGSVAGHYDITNRLTARARALRVEDETEIDSTADQTDGVQQTLTAELDWTPVDTWRSRLSVGNTLSDSDSRDHGGDRFITRRESVTWQNDLFLTENHITTLGVDYYEDDVSVTPGDQSFVPGDYTETSRDNLAVFAQHQWYAGPLDLQGAVRYDDNEAYGGETTGSVAGGYAFSETVRSYLSWGSAFKAPSFNELYYPFDGFFQGNSELDPERSRTWEIGLEGNDIWQWRLAAFHTEIDDLIVNQRSDNGVLMPFNVEKARIQGVEGEISGRIAGVDTRLAATWLDAENRETGDALIRRPSFKSTLDLSRAFGAITVGSQVHYGGERHDEDVLGNTVVLDDYTVVDLTAAWHINDEWTLRGKVANALDEDYQTVDTYNMPGRTVLVSINWQAAR